MASSGYTAITFVANEQPTTAKWNLIGSNDSSFNLGTGLEDGVIVNRHLAVDSVTSQKLVLNFFRMRHQAQNANSAPTDLKVQTGWKYSLGNNSNVINMVVTLPEAFSTLIYTAASPVGARIASSGAPTSLVNFDVAFGGTGVPGAAAKPNGTNPLTQLDLQLMRTATLDNSYYWGVSWIAIGT